MLVKKLPSGLIVENYRSEVLLKKSLQKPLLKMSVLKCL